MNRSQVNESDTPGSPELRVFSMVLESIFTTVVIQPPHIDGWLLLLAVEDGHLGQVVHGDRGRDAVVEHLLRGGLLLHLEDAVQGAVGVALRRGWALQREHGGPCDRGSGPRRETRHRDV